MAFKPYKKFKDKADAELLIKLLEEHRVNYDVEELPELRETEDDKNLPVVVNVEGINRIRLDRMLSEEEERQKQFEVFEYYETPAQTEVMTKLLDQHDIAYKVGHQNEVDPGTFTSMFGKHDQYYLMVRLKDFKRVRQLVKTQSKVYIKDFDEDYYLYEYSDAELLEILEHQDQWHVNDITMAQRILSERGRHYNDEDIELFRKRRWIELRRAEKVPASKLALGYLLALFGGIIGLYVGWHYYYDQSYDPDGRVFYTFDRSVRAHGLWIMRLGGLMFLLTIAFFVWSNMLQWAQ